jgi:hypothetical protein
MIGMRTDHQDAIALGQGVTEREPPLPLADYLARQ